MDKIEKNTELKNLKNLEKTFQSFLKLTPDFIYIKDTEHRFMYTSDSFAKLTNHNSWRDLVGKTDFDIFPQEHAKVYFEKEKDVIQNGKDLTNLEEPYYNEDGKLCYVTSSKRAMYDEDGNIIGLFGISRDITETKEKEKIILEEKEKFEAIFNHSSDGIALFDLDSNFLDFNDAYMDMLGYTRDELKQESCISLTPTEYREDSIKALEQTIKDGYIKNFEKRCLTKDGQQIVINLTANVLPDGKRVIAIAKNVSSLKRIEEQERLISMGELIGNIAHQWRQPLSVIAMASNNIQLESDLGTLDIKDIKKYTKTINENTRYLSNTIDTFRDFIKGNKEYLEVDLKDVIEKSLSIVDSSIKNNYINLLLDIDDDLRVIGNEHELEQTFINLINNAKDLLVFQENSDKYIVIDAKKSNNRIEINIQDNAGGIDKDILPKVFQPYFTTKHKSIGTGLGLTIVDKIIREHHNGEIKVENKEFSHDGKKYKGACFTIILQGIE